MSYADNWTKHHPELHHRNIRKEYLTPTIVLEMLWIEQQQQQQVVGAAWNNDDKARKLRFGIKVRQRTDGSLPDQIKTVRFAMKVEICTIPNATSPK
jgi:hypothetical protein